MPPELKLSSPVFIIGCPRSGTSALGWSVGNHPDFWTSAESDFMYHVYGRTNRLRKVYDKLAQSRDKPRWLVANDVDFPEFMMYVGLGIDQMYLSRSGGKRWVEQSPLYTLIARDLKYMFPNGKFLHALRDGRLVANSMIHSGFHTRWASDFKFACETWVSYVQMCQKLEADFPDYVYTVRNEDMVADPESATAKYQNFLEVAYSDEPAKFLRSHWINSSFGDERKTARAHSGADWDDEMKATFNEIAGETMQELGYPLA